MAFEYQEVLQWLLNMGLSPENAPSGQPRHQHLHRLHVESPNLFNEINTVPYPYQVLRNFYTTQRQRFHDINSNLLNTKKSCKILYIDTFIEEQCNPFILRVEWKKGSGDGLYPPLSLQSMLRILLVPGESIENKYMLFVYLFLDLSIALEDDRYIVGLRNIVCD
jgi:hypothetical protein